MISRGALLKIDMLLSACVDGGPSNNPLPDPQIGACYIIGQQPTGEWAGHANALAGFSEGGWRFIEAREGMSVSLAGSGETMHWRNNSWEIGVVRANEVRIAGTKVVGTRQPAVAAPSGGDVIDAEARAAILEILGALQAHGLVET